MPELVELLPGDESELFEWGGGGEEVGEEVGEEDEEGSDPVAGFGIVDDFDDFDLSLSIAAVSVSSSCSLLFSANDDEDEELVTVSRLAKSGSMLAMERSCFAAFAAACVGSLGGGGGEADCSWGGAIHDDAEAAEADDEGER